MRQYGGHYKVNSPPVNFPATLDQIIDITTHAKQVATTSSETKR